MAQDLEDFSLDHLTIRTPGYPVLLAITGSAESPSRELFYVGLLFHALSVWFVLVVLFRLGAGPGWLLVVGAVLWLPYHVQAAGTVLSENLTEFVLTGACIATFWGVIKDSKLLLLVAGVGMAAAPIVRPTYQVFFGAASLAVWLAVLLERERSRLRRRARKMMMITSAAAILVFTGYSLYYHQRFGYFGITHAVGINLCDKTAHFVERLSPRYEPLRTILIESRNDSLVRGVSHTAEQYPWDHWGDIVKRSGKGDVALAKELARLNATLIFHNPLNYLQSVSAAFGGLFFPYTTKLSTGDSQVLQTLWTLLHFLTVGAFLIQFIVVAGDELRGATCAFYGVPGERGAPTFEERTAYYLSLFCVGYTIVISSLADTGNPRYRSPSDVMMVLNLALGYLLWRKRTLATVAAGTAMPAPSPVRFP